MDLSALVRSFATATGYQITRKARGAIVKGKVATGTVSTLSMVASVHPVSPNDLDRLMQGRHFNEAKQFITTIQLYPGGQGASYEADVVSIGSTNYEVTKVETWFDPVSGSTAYRVTVIDV